MGLTAWFDHEAQRFSYYINETPGCSCISFMVTMDIKLVTSTKSWESKGLEDLNIWFAVVNARFIVHLKKIIVMDVILILLSIYSQQ